MQTIGNGYKKLNNNGFTLLEVLIAMIILAVISIPMLRAFSTVANTNSKSRLQLGATNAAESIMERSKTLSLDDFVAYYQGKNTDSDGDGVADSFAMPDIAEDAAAPSGAYMKPSGICGFSLDNTTKVKVSDLKLPKDYTIEVTLDPKSRYEDLNKWNRANLTAISGTSSAIYTMRSDMDSEALEDYSAYSKDFLGEESGKEADYFKDKIKRTIFITVDKTGTTTDAKGEDIDMLDVVVSVEYEVNDLVVPTANRKIRKVNKQTIYTNSTSKQKLDSLYIMYFPLYEVANKKDVINIDNSENVDLNVYIVAQDINAHKTKWNIYRSQKHLDIIVKEDESDTVEKAHTTLLTNVHEAALSTDTKDLPQKKGDPKVNISFNLSYCDSIKVIKSGEDAADILSTSNLDGRLLNVNNVENRIYKMTVIVKNGAGEEVARIEGSKLEKENY